jgi:hypothetical protein
MATIGRHTMYDSQQPKTAFAGWLRRGRGPWRVVAAGASYGECLAELLKVKCDRHADRLVLAAGRDPNQKARTR